MLACVTTAAAASQTTAPGRETAARAALLAQGWGALAQGDLAQAASAAQRVLAQSPRDAGGVALAVEVEIARSGPVAGLDAYERWLAAKRVEEAYVLRRVAMAYLRGVLRQRQEDARLHALEALAADGDGEAEASLANAAAAGGVAENRALASLGDHRAVKVLIGHLQSLPDTRGTIDALVASGSATAIPPLVQLLADARDDARAAAADGLGRLGARQTIDQLKPLLNDRSFPVRMSAAAALYRMDDNSGATFLDQLLTSEHAAIRLGAAEALSVRPGGAWQNVARALTSDPDQLIQLKAARLMAPYDRELAESVLERLLQSDNLAIREEASRVFADRVANDFRTLRKLLRSADVGTTVRAADRILELTR